MDIRVTFLTINGEFESKPVLRATFAVDPVTGLPVAGQGMEVDPGTGQVQMIGPDGQPVVVAADGQQMVVGPDGQYIPASQQVSEEPIYLTARLGAQAMEWVRADLGE